jgi:hypothetical protein
MNFLFIGSLSANPAAASSDDLAPAMLRLREGTGGQFSNLVLSNVANFAVKQNKCGDELRTSTSPSLDLAPDVLYFSKDNIVDGPGQDFDLSSDCQGLTSVTRTDPKLLVIPTSPTFMSQYDPRPAASSPVFEGVAQPPSDDTFFEDAGFMGAFPTEVSGFWLNYGILWDSGRFSPEIYGIDASCGVEGDCNADGEVNVGDVTFLQNYITTPNPDAPCVFFNCDVNNDGALDVVDLNAIVRRLVTSK